MKYVKTFEEFSEELKYHIENDLSLNNTVFRIGSDSHIKLFNEVKKYWSESNIILNNTEKWMVENLKIGQKAKFKEGSKYVDVVLDTPKVGGSRRFFVYHDSGKKIEEEILAIRVEWGDPTTTIKNHIPGNAASFWARHKCDTKMDPKTAGFWACYAPTLFGKQLGLQSEEPW